jgi:hypothetical protein
MKVHKLHLNKYQIEKSALSKKRKRNKTRKFKKQNNLSKKRKRNNTLKIKKYRKKVGGTLIPNRKRKADDDDLFCNMRAQEGMQTQQELPQEHQELPQEQQEQPALFCGMQAPVVKQPAVKKVKSNTDILWTLIMREREEREEREREEREREREEREREREREREEREREREERERERKRICELAQIEREWTESQVREDGVAPGVGLACAPRTAKVPEWALADKLDKTIIEQNKIPSQVIEEFFSQNSKMPPLEGNPDESW